MAPAYGLQGQEGSRHEDDGVAAPRAMAASCNLKRTPSENTSENTMLQRKSALLRTVLRTCRDINTIVKSKELVQFAYAFTVPANTGTQVAINKSTYKAHTQRTNSSIDPLCVW